MEQFKSEELESMLGENIKRIRLRLNIDQQTLCNQTKVSLTALKNLESGRGATIKTLIKILHGLRQTEWLHALSPAPSNDLTTDLTSHTPRQRARRNKNE